jgi:hypothetical protein
MAVQTVACPGCKATLKAPEQMAGKKAKCKKCGETFRIPGGPAPSGEPEGDSQFLSAMDVPSPPPSANPFDFGGAAETLPEPKPKAKEKSTVVEKPKERKPEPPKVEKKPESKAEKKPEPKGEKKAERKPEKVPVPAAEPVDDDEDIPAAAIVEEDEPEEAPAEATSDPFSFDAPSAPKGKSKDKGKEKPREEKKEKPKAKAAGGNAFSFDEASGEKPNLEPEDDDDPKPSRKKRRDSKVGFTPKERPAGGGLTMGKLLIAAGVFAVIVGGIVGGVIYAISGNKPSEQVNNEKKDPPPKTDPTPPTTPPEPTPPNKGETPKTPEPKPKDPTPPKKDPTPKAAGGLILPAGRTITFLPPAAKPESVQEPNTRVSIVPTLPAKSVDAFAAARKVFPPQKKGNDIAVVWQLAPGLQNLGEKLMLGLYSPQTNKQASKVEFEGDNSPQPVCDLSVDGTLFVHGHLTKNAITVFDTRTGAKILDGFTPYAGKKDVKLAAVYLTEPPLFFMTVSTMGEVNAFNVRNPKDAKPGKFAPAKPPKQPLVAGKHIVPGADRLSVMMFAGGSFYSVTVAPDVKGTELVKFDGEVGRVFGMASGSKTVIAFETEDKKDRAVMEVRTDGQHVFHRWPDKDAGEPSAVAWVDDGLVMVASTTGSVLWFESEGKDFKPVGLARTPVSKGLHVASDGHWTLLPDPANPKQCVLVEYSKPQSGLIGVLDSGKQPPIVILNDKGLLK